MGPPGMELLGRDPDLGSEPQLAAVDESRGRVDQHRGRVNFEHEPVGCRDAGGHDGLGVPGAETADVANGVVERADHRHRELEIEELGRVLVVGGHPGPSDADASCRVAHQFDAG